MATSVGRFAIIRSAISTARQSSLCHACSALVVFGFDPQSVQARPRANSGFGRTEPQSQRKGWGHVKLQARF